MKSSLPFEKGILLFVSPLHCTKTSQGNQCLRIFVIKKIFWPLVWIFDTTFTILNGASTFFPLNVQFKTNILAAIAYFQTIYQLSHTKASAFSFFLSFFPPWIAYLKLKVINWVYFIPFTFDIILMHLQIITFWAHIRKTLKLPGLCDAGLHQHPFWLKAE